MKLYLLLHGRFDFFKHSLDRFVEMYELAEEGTELNGTNLSESSSGILPLKWLDKRLEARFYSRKSA